VRPTILDNLPWDSEVAGTELFGPVLGVMHVGDHRAGHRDGEQRAVREHGVPCSRAASRRAAVPVSEPPRATSGINVGVAAPMAFFPFSGWKESFFGVQHGQGTDAVEFFTQKKVVVERWPKAWSRQF
jgi:malonate-semialdehyde dehydrogenase (acetylating)/methylmalonate-semialdehyde dehydrogenase